MKIFRFLFLVALPVYLVSCGTQKKVPAYYLDKVIRDTTINSNLKFPELSIQKNDLLSISIYSASTELKADLPYNLPEAAANTGFLVDANGNIEYPRLGTIHAEGLTKLQLAEEIKKKLTQPVELLRNPSVIIRFLNYKITVLGQVSREGMLTLPGERVTILEAIGLAGGITDYGKKDDIKIRRERDGKIEIGSVDLSSDSLFYSPYYNLVQNDVIIVQPTKQKAKMNDQSLAMQRIGFALSIITTAAIIYNIFK
jgi:polysaccharide export outer membrane protein